MHHAAKLHYFTRTEPIVNSLCCLTVVVFHHEIVRSI